MKIPTRSRFAHNQTTMLCRRHFVVASAAIVACGIACKGDDEQAAARVLDHHFDALKRRAYDSALSDYDAAFYSEVTPGEWRVALGSVVDKLGTFRSYQVLSFGVAYKQVAGPGLYLRFLCTVTYSRHSAEETFYMFRRKAGSNFTIVGHQIEAEGLRK